MELLHKIRAILNPRTAENGRPDVKNPQKALAIAYGQLLRLADQIESHAGKAPYPHVAARLRHIAVEKQNSANTLRERISDAGGELKELRPEIKSGKNHWERMVLDIEDQKMLEAQLLDEALLLASDAPETSNLLRKIAFEQVPHREMLLDLVARADPQADLT